MNERVKKLRKELGLTLEKFGERLGVKKAVLSQIENGKANLTDQMFKAICNVSWDGRHVNEEWLRDGTGEMFKADPNNELKALAEKYHMSDTEYAFLKEFFKLEPSQREDFFKTLDKVFSAVHAGNLPETPAANHTIQEMSRKEIHAELDRQLDAEKEAVENAQGYGHGSSGTAIG